VSHYSDGVRSRRLRQHAVSDSDCRRPVRADRRRRQEAPVSDRRHHPRPRDRRLLDGRRAPHGHLLAPLRLHRPRAGPQSTFDLRRALAVAAHPEAIHGRDADCPVLPAAAVDRRALPARIQTRPR